MNGPAAHGPDGHHLRPATHDGRLPPRDVLLAVEGLTRPVPLRDRIDQRHVQRLATVLEECPPVVVTTDGHLVDGEHRVAAAHARGWTQIPAVVIDCPPGEVHAKALELNVGAALTLTRAERRAAVRVQLESRPEHSDRAIAKLCGVAPSTVGAVRSEVSGVQTEHLKRRGLDGKTYPTADPARRRLVEDHLRLHPAATISELRDLTGASTGSIST